jgi:hypothetical protein
MWLCQCDCGNKTIVKYRNLINGNTKSCGCLKQEKTSKRCLIDMIGRKCGKLTVIERCGLTKQNSVAWLCECECGTRIIADGIKLRNGKINNCGCIKHNVTRLPFGEAAYNSIVCGIKKGAKKRDLEWNLTDEQVRSLITQSCYYCGKKPMQTNGIGSRLNGVFFYNGLDRVNNSLGYTIDNVVPCCKFCNRAKDVMTIDEFKTWIYNVYEHFYKENKKSI